MTPHCRAMQVLPRGSPGYPLELSSHVGTWIRIIQDAKQGMRSHKVATREKLTLQFFAAQLPLLPMSVLPGHLFCSLKEGIKF